MGKQSRKCHVKMVKRLNSPHSRKTNSVDFNEATIIIILIFPTDTQMDYVDLDSSIFLLSFLAVR